MQDVLIIGSGPAALLAADKLSQKKFSVSVFERRPSAAWKLLVAGSSGLNITNGCTPAEFPSFFRKGGEQLKQSLETFTRDDWLSYIKDLGEEPYLGTSGRYFIRNHSAAKLLQAWSTRLSSQGVRFEFCEEFVGLDATKASFASGRKESARAILLALGGGSWEATPPRWPQALGAKGVEVRPLQAANTGFALLANGDFFAKAEGKAIKGLILSTRLGTKQGELLITRYGLEGTPVYTVGCSGPAHFDLKPELTREKVEARLKEAKGNLRRRLGAVKLSEGAELLLEEFAPEAAWENSRSLAEAIKDLVIELGEARPLSEAISASGGVAWDELTDDLELKKIPGVFCAGEMIDWDAPTGGFLIQASVSTGYRAALAIAKRLTQPS